MNLLKSYSKSLSIALFIILSVSTASSQIRFGVRGGYDVISHKINTDILNAHNRLGFHIGPTVEIGLLMLNVDASLLYGQQKFDLTDANNESSNISDYHYLSLPVNLKKRFGIGSIFGVYILGGVYGTVKLKGGDIHLAQEDFKSKNYQLGLNAGAGVTVFRNFDLGMYFRYKLTDNYATDKPQIADFAKLKEKTWTVALTYFFN